MDPINILIDRLREIGSGFIELLPQIVVAVVLLFVTWLIVRGVIYAYRRATSRTDLRRSLKDVFEKLIRIAIWVVGLLIAATVLFPTLTPGKLLAGLGVGSIAIGLAFKDIFENLLAGILILMREPMRIGDFIECEGVEGVVEKISIRDTYIRKTDGQLVLVPNGLLYKNPVFIVTDQVQRRISLICGVAYKEDVDKAREIIHGCLKECETVNTDKDTEVRAVEFGASSIDFEILWWTGSKPAEARASKDEIVARIKAALDDAGIEIPFPYRTLTFDQPLEIDRAKRDTG